MARQTGEIERFEGVRARVKTFEVPWIDAGEIVVDLASDAAKGDGAHFSKDGNRLIGEAIAHELAPLLRSRIASMPDAT